MVSITEPFKAIASWFTPASRGKEIIEILEQIAKGNFNHEVKILKKEKNQEHKQILKGLKITLQELMAMSAREKRRRRQIINANVLLRGLDKNKREFMELASHQLKTPLASLQLGLDLLGRKSAKWAEEEQLILKQVVSSYEHLAKLVASLLAAVKVNEKTAMKPKILTTSLSHIALALEQQFAGRFKTKGIKFIVINPDHTVQMKTDPEFLIEILHNLLENAYKYTPAGQVWLEIAEKNDSIEFTVKDTGIGLPRAEQSKAFDKLFRASNVKNMSDAGSGLGLYYTKQLVKNLKGKIWFESIEGQGSTFQVSLPR